MMMVLMVLAVWLLLSLAACVGWAVFRASVKDELSPVWLWAVPVLFVIGAMLDILLG